MGLILFLMLGTTKLFPVMWDRPTVTPINYQDFPAQIHHSQGQTFASVFAINVLAHDTTDSTVALNPGTGYLCTVLPSTYAAPTITSGINAHLLSAVVATEEVTEHFLLNFL
jgi:hypothetical protein